MTLDNLLQEQLARGYHGEMAGVSTWSLKARADNVTGNLTASVIKRGRLNKPHIGLMRMCSLSF